MVYCSPSRAVTKDVRISLKSVVNFTTQFAFLQRMPATDRPPSEDSLQEPVRRKIKGKEFAKSSILKREATALILAQDEHSRTHTTAAGGRDHRSIKTKRIPRKKEGNVKEVESSDKSSDGPLHAPN